jgi:choloylglycine hydrolase
MFTRYTSCCAPGEGRYYFTTYENRRITALDMHREDLSGNALLRYSLLTRENIRLLN